MTYHQTSGADIDLAWALAGVALSIRLDAVSDRARHMAGHCLVDWAGVTLAGWQEPPVQAVAALARADGGREEAVLLGTDTRLPARAAALVNGTASHALDLDDVHLTSRVHPSAPVLPVICALAHRTGASGAQAATAFLAGVEVQSRLARMMGEAHYKAGWHNTATLGTFGAATAAGLMLGLSAEALTRALQLASTMATGLRASFGTMAKPLHAGRAAEAGLLAAELAGQGMTGPAKGLAAFAAQTGAVHLPEAALAPRAALEAEAIIFKYHASCYGTQAPIETALRLRAQAPDADGPITLRVEPQYLDVCAIPDPRSAAQTRFSIAHCVALALAGRDTMSDAAFGAEAVDDPELAAIRARVSVEADPEMPRANAALTCDGIDIRYDASTPEADIPRQAERLTEKFATLTGQADLARAGLGLSEMPRLSDWLDRVAA